MTVLQTDGWPRIPRRSDLGHSYYRANCCGWVEVGRQLIGGPLLAAAEPVIAKSDVLLALVTVEGLLFAALSISATMASGGTFGAKTLGPPWLLAVISAAILGLVSAAAVLSWIDLFGGSNWPSSSDRLFEALGLLLAIVAQPAVAIIIAVGLVKN